MVQMENLAKSENEQSLQTSEATPTIIGLHAFGINLYLYAFFELILFFDPHYSLWSKREI